MKEIVINKDQAGQRLDRFVRKYLNDASLSFIYKQIRKKNITVNDKKANEKYFLELNDSVKLYFSDETIEKFQSTKPISKSAAKLDIVYEDSNIIIINKPVGILSHSSKKGYREENIVDSMRSYLIGIGDYVPRRTDTFTPSLANRLDRNTSGILIGAKTFNAIQEINKAQRNGLIKKYYHTVVSGSVKGEKTEYASIEKVANKENLVKISESDKDKAKDIITAYKSLITGKKFSLLEIDLITGRTHQIRAHLSYLKMPIVGDRKYGNKKINTYFLNKYSLNNQLLHCKKISIDGLSDEMEYLNGKIFEIDNTTILENIIKGELYEKS